MIYEYRGSRPNVIYISHQAWEDLLAWQTEENRLKKLGPRLEKQARLKMRLKSRVKRGKLKLPE
jgi:hypothetical protein